ncbi:MAG TPA: arginine--tRNA ligase [bacterium]|nr:arginine--tRNA ligase [bacterium]HPL95733.1 arginine--tRNA ligase [bacterium]
MMTIKTTLKNEIAQAIKDLYGLADLSFTIDYPPTPEFGAYSCNVAMILARELKISPMDIAHAMAQKLENNKIWEKIAVVKPGFINFYLADKILQDNLDLILKEKEKFGYLKSKKKEKIMVEFISANPTGPLTLANGRGGFSGDVLANVLKLTGHKVEREYYINDYGNQVRALGHSILKDDEAQYSGEYINELAKKIKMDPRLREDDKNDDKTKKDDIAFKIGEVTAKIILEEMIKPVVKKAGIKFDTWFSEKTLHDSGAVEKMFQYLKNKNLVYEHDGAVWLKTTESEENIDDKDRVLIKSTGEKTYFLADIAYHFDKFKKRKFDKVINLWGADHYGYVARMKQAVALLGFPNQLEILLMQMVRLIKNGQEFKMSKRAGIYVTLEELIDMVGLDVTRFFFLMHANNKQMDFDLDLAKERSQKNPVFYVQYAHARICSILEKVSSVKVSSVKVKKELHNSEKELIKELIKWPEIVAEVALNYEVHKICFYTIALADKFHDFYENCRVIEENNQVNDWRLNLVRATKQVLKNVLTCLGVNAPEKM